MFIKKLGYVQNWSRYTYSRIIKNNFKGTMGRFVGRDNVFSFMSSVKKNTNILEKVKKFLYPALAMVKQLGIPIYFLTLLCADLRWEELPYIINKSKNLDLSDKELKNVSYQELCNLLNNNPVLVARRFQYKVGVFSQKSHWMVHWGKTKYYAIRVEFQEQGIPHAHSFVLIFNAPNTQNETVYIAFIKKAIDAQFPNHLKYPEIFELVKTYQVDAHSGTCWKYNKNECRFSYGRYFTEKTIIAKPIDSSLSNDEKGEILSWRNTLLQQVKSYNDNNLNSAKVNVIDSTKGNFTQPLCVQEILGELRISRVACYSISIPYQKTKIYSYIRSDNLIPALLIIILMLI